VLLVPTSSTIGSVAGRVNAADQGVQRELADRDAHAADTLIADAENPFAVGDDDHVDVGTWPVLPAARGLCRAADRR